MKKNDKNKNQVNNIYAILAISVIVITLVYLGTIFLTNSELGRSLTGFAVGYVNLTVNTNLAVDISPTWGINWSNGSIGAGLTNATLTTVQNESSVIGGNWSTVGVSGIMIINSGNVNASLFINGTKNSTDWFGSGGDPRLYQWNVTNAQALGGCHGGMVPLSTWKDVNHTAIKFCAQFSSLSINNKVWLDVKLQVPSDLANPNTALTDTLTITANTAG